MMNEYYVIAPTNYDINHHGILGQKWGKQNGPPYPLGSGDHSAAEKRAGWKKSLSSGAKTAAKAAGKAVKATAKTGAKVVKKQCQMLVKLQDLLERQLLLEP